MRPQHALGITVCVQHKCIISRWQEIWFLGSCVTPLSPSDSILTAQFQPKWLTTKKMGHLDLVWLQNSCWLLLCFEWGWNCFRWSHVEVTDLLWQCGLVLPQVSLLLGDVWFAYCKHEADCKNRHLLLLSQAMKVHVNTLGNVGIVCN